MVFSVVGLVGLSVAVARIAVSTTSIAGLSSRPFHAAVARLLSPIVLLIGLAVLLADLIGLEPGKLVRRRSDLVYLARYTLRLLALPHLICLLVRN